MIGFSVCLASYLHTIDPYALKLWDDGPIRWYGLAYLVGFLIGYILIRRVAKVGVSTLDPQKAGDFVVAVALGVVIGGRLGYCVFYRPDLLVDFHGSLPFWGALEINKGGMASHGGILGGLIACTYYAIRHHHSKLFLVDLVAFGAPLGLFFGRIANFINGELYGRACDPGFPLAVRFPQEMYDWTPDRIAQLDRALPRPVDLGIVGQQWTLPRIIEQIQAGHPQVIALVEPMITPRHPSQLYAALLEGLLVFLVLAVLWFKPRKPGTLMCAFFVVYGSVRIFDELFRMPDAHLGFQALGLTRGQWLSVPLVLMGVIGWVWCSRRKVNPMGGWRSTSSLTG